MKFFICTDYVSSRTIIISVDVVEAIHEITEDEYRSHFQLDEQTAINGDCTLVRIKGGGVYYISNPISDIIKFLKGAENG